MQVDLLYFPSSSLRTTEWHLGDCRVLWDNPRTLAPVIEAWLDTTTADYCLFWDLSLGSPDTQAVLDTLNLPGDIWHSGLCLGMRGLPSLIDYVNPTWMLNRDANPEIVSTSWRMTLKACLMRTGIMRQLGGLDASFDTLDGAALDMGHRYMTRGAFMRHVPGLLPYHREQQRSAPGLTLYDELRLIGQQYGWKWAHWSLFRAALKGDSLLSLARAYKRLKREKVRPLPAPYKRTQADKKEFEAEEWRDKITVLIPTLERYPYLKNELFQLRRQTVAPLEIIVIDQTPDGERQMDIASEFSDLPIRLFHQNALGQCTAWNKGLLESRGEYILFLGDDADRIEPTFLEKFLRTFQTYGADMVASVVDEVGAGPPPFSCTFMRISDIFPIAMIKREALRLSGLMDFAYDRAKRADGDLGMRCHCSGALMVLNPEIRLLHHRAPQGGLRKHGVRVVTYANSKKSIRLRNLPSVSEIYLTLRHFSRRQAHEELWLRTFSSMTARDGKVKRLLKTLLGVVTLPDTLWQIRQRYLQAVKLLNDYPQIPTFPEPVPEPVEPEIAAQASQ